MAKLVKQWQSKSIEMRFWEKVRKGETDECWEWQGAKSRDGYGRLRRPGPAKTEHRDLRAHHIAWQIENGPVPQGMCVLHKCDNPPCCNPKHLFLGTRTVNNADKKEKGRSADRHGTNNSNVKLTEGDVIEIRKLASLGMSQMQVAALFSVKQPQISRIVRGESWGSLNTQADE